MTNRLFAPLALFLIPLMLLVAACSPTVPATEPSIESSSESVEPSPTTEDVSDPVDELQRVADKPLADQGPWWTFSSTDGLYAINPDGTGLTRFHKEPIYYPHLLQIQTAPSGGHIAYLTGNEIYDTTISVMVFPWHTLVTEKSLTSEESEPGPDSIPGDPEVEAVRALVDAPSLAFSPDGRYLAFMGAIDGPTSDLYVFSLDNNQTTRLSSGPSQAYQPVWSPDGKYIVHTGVSTFGTGAGYSMEGIWAALADSSGVIDLYDPPARSGTEEIVGWVDDRTFVVHSWDAGCGPKNLRTFNIETGQSDVLWPEYFSSVAYDPENDVAILGVRFEDCNTDAKEGLFHVPTDGRPPFRIVEDRPFQIFWSPEADLFLSLTEFGTIAFSPSGEYIDLDAPQGAEEYPAIAPGSRDLAWPGDSLWVGSLLGTIENPPKVIFDEPVYRVTWDPGGTWVIFFSDRGLYVAEAPDYVPLLVAEELDNINGYTGWVNP